MTIEQCGLIELPTISDARGNLSFVEGDRHLPFSIQRVYHLYDVPGGGRREGHAHKTFQQFVVATSGSFDVILNDGRREKRIHLNRAFVGLYICPMIWLELDNFSTGSVCMVLASAYFDESDYYRSYSEYAFAVGLSK